MAGASARTLQYGCSAAGVSPRACRNLARLLRLAVRAAQGEWDPLAQLDADPRTVKKLVTQCSLGIQAPPQSIETLLVQQTLVESPSIKRLLRKGLARFRDSSTRHLR
jgi:hypothetical protein